MATASRTSKKQPSLHDYSLKIPIFTFYGGRKQATKKKLFFFQNLNVVPKKSTPGKFAYIWHFQRIGISATKLEKNSNSFQSDVYAAVAVVDANTP